MIRRLVTMLGAVVLPIGCSSDPTERTLTIDVVGNGTTDPAPGIHRYEDGTTVTLRAKAASGSVSKGWTGDVTGNAEELKIRLDADRNVTALFRCPSGARARTPPMTILFCPAITPT